MLIWMAGACVGILHNENWNHVFFSTVSFIVGHSSLNSLKACSTFVLFWLWVMRISSIYIKQLVVCCFIRIGYICLVCFIRI
jgi:hypothetical protein